jgi:hypothetical protein
MIFIYLKETLDFGLWYPRSEDFTLAVYTDANWEGRIDDRKCTSGGSFFLSNYLVSWLSKKKSSISLSIEEVEYIATIAYCTQVLWMKKIQYIKVEYKHSISIMRDNTSSINISKNPIMHLQEKEYFDQVSFPSRTSYKTNCQARMHCYHGTYCI